MTKKERLSIFVACASVVIIVVVSVIIGIEIIEKPAEAQLKDDRAKLYVVDENGMCWASNHGSAPGMETRMATGYGNLWFRNPKMSLFLDKPTSDKRISKILQLDIKHCVRIDK